ncbi:MAG: serine hydrolase, partial [Novosphingobium sp.]
MVSRRISLILTLLALPALWGCGNDTQAPPPLSEAAMAAVRARPGVPRETLARAVDALFTADDVGETRAVLILRGGEVVAERYAPGYGPDTRFLGWSMSKTVIGVM